MPVFAISSNVEDKNKPIEIQADFAVFDDKKRIATYLGHVVMIQGSRRLNSHTLIIHGDAHGKIASMEATGDPAYFHAQPKQQKPLIHGQAKKIDYLPKQDKILLLEDALLIQNAYSIRGNRLVYSLLTQILYSEPIAGKQTTLILPSKE